MKRAGSVLATLAVASIVMGGLCSRAEAASPDEIAITGVEHKLAGATTAQDAMKNYDPTDQVTVLDMGGPQREHVGQKDVRADMEKGFAGMKDIKVQFLELKVITDGKLGYARSIQRFTATGPDGKPVDITFRETDLLHKVNGQWKILEQHISVPIDMATGKALMASSK
jgi:ketosteroid isomerase-like protein